MCRRAQGRVYGDRRRDARCRDAGRRRDLLRASKRTPRHAAKLSRRPLSSGPRSLWLEDNVPVFFFQDIADWAICRPVALHSLFFRFIRRYPYEPRLPYSCEVTPAARGRARRPLTVLDTRHTSGLRVITRSKGESDQSSAARASTYECMERRTMKPIQRKLAAQLTE